MSSQELLFCLGHCIVHCVKVMEELKMNRSEIFNFALRRCLYFTWCNNLFLNNSKVLPEISLHIYHAIGPVRKQKLLGWYDSNLTVQIQFKSDDMSTFIVSHIIFHNSRYRYAAVSCMERYEKMLKPFFLYFQNINCLFTVLSCEHKNGTPDLFPVWFMWAWTSRYKRRASEAVYII